MVLFTSGFVNAIPNDARYKKANRSTLEHVCEASFQGDTEALEKLLATGNEDEIFNYDVNMHFTDICALHFASMAGQEKCVKMLLEAKADPHMRQSVKAGVDPATGETAKQKAEKFGHTSVVAMLKAAEAASPPGWYEKDGIANNKKLYSEPKPEPEKKPEPKAAPAPTPAKAAAATASKSTEPSLPVALLFPGQGSQYVKMLDGVKDVPEVKEMLAKAKTVLGYDLLELCLKGPEEKLAETKYCQPALFVGGLAGVAKLRSEKPDQANRPQCVAGLSLGEYTALCAAGALSFEDGLKLVQLRGAAMGEAAAVGKQGMLSVVGLERDVLDGLCKEAAAAEGKDAVCQVANVLFPKGFSCAGTEKAIHELQAKADKKGALQTRLLKTSGGFHTSLMQPAAEKLSQALTDVLPNMKPPTCTVYMNVTGKPIPAGTPPADIVEMLKKQLVNPVQWCPSVECMIKDGVKEFYECGPQKQIKAMMKRIDNKVWKDTANVEV